MIDIKFFRFCTKTFQGLHEHKLKASCNQLFSHLFALMSYLAPRPLHWSASFWVLHIVTEQITWLQRISAKRRCCTSNDITINSITVNPSPKFRHLKNANVNDDNYNGNKRRRNKNKTMTAGHIPASLGMLFSQNDPSVYSDANEIDWMLKNLQTRTAAMKGCCWFFQTPGSSQKTTTLPFLPNDEIQDNAQELSIHEAKGKQSSNGCCCWGTYSFETRNNNNNINEAWRTTTRSISWQSIAFMSGR